MTFHTFILILHVFGAGLLIGVGVLAFLAVYRPPLTDKSLDRLGFVGKYGMWASFWQFATGAILMGMEWSETSHNPLVWTKIILWVIDGAIASRVLRNQVQRVRTAMAANQPPPQANLKMVLGLYAVIILAIAALGVMVAEA